MSLWMQTTGKLYLPPQKPVAKVLNTDDFIKRTGYYFHGGTERLLMVGHPYYDVMDTVDDEKVAVPKVSAQQFRVLRLRLPDPNKFAIADEKIFNPEKERLVWRLTGLEIGRGGPLGISPTGHPLFNKYTDTENPNTYPTKQDENNDYRQDISVDPKQIQMFIVGCTPATGEYWDVTKPCKDRPLNNGDCPPIELFHTYIQDGDMCEFGFGNANFESFQQDRAGVPLELTNETALWPDFLKMTKDIYGDQVFFYSKREQLYARHYFAKAGVDGDALPPTSYLNPDDGKPQKDLGPYSYYSTPSGSLVSSDSNMFNRPYWLHRALGANNGILWGNQCFITVVDNTRNINFGLSIYKQQANMTNEYKYKSGDFRNYLRHVEEYEVEIIVELCKVPLDPDVLAHINVMNPRILDEWELAFVPPPPQGIEDSYRYILSLATKCPADVIPAEKPDPWDKYTFWEIDMTEKLSAELSQFSLGKRFLYQSGLLKNKRIRDSDDIGETRRSVKRKRRN
ncbi:major capsid protein L1 [Human papillomavirus 156]|uniref:Major capsid protein L1 n=2 Tax=Papillomaviridae TaxID=151340 RepID=A0A1Q1PPG5_9PAPI|nr:major capsid protein L1 [Human papillomavirus 156]AFV67971.1 major capsid protein L1 [Human papillomavirus 156]AQM73710.1 L1 [Human papillomavirus]